MAFTVADRQRYLLERERLPQNEAAVFVETRLASESQFVRNEALDQIVTIEEDRKWAQISAELWKQAENEKTQIFDLMEKVQEKLQKKYGKSDQAPHAAYLNVRTATWPQVLDQVGQIAHQWSSSRKTSNISVFVEKMGRNSEAFQNWLQVLPNGDYGSSICGVFSLAISAAGHYYKAEDAVFDGLAEIPEILDNAKRYIQIYSETRYSNLERKTFDLYISILRALKHVLKFFADSSTRRFCEPIWKQSSYQQELQSSLDDIRKQMERVKEEANQCAQAKIEDINRGLLRYGDLLQQVHDDSSQFATILQAIYRQLQMQCAQISRLSEAQCKSTSGPHKEAIDSTADPVATLSDAPPNYAQTLRLLQLLQPDLDDSDDDDEEIDDLTSEFIEATEQEVAASLNQVGTMTAPAGSKAVAFLGEERFKAFMDMGERTGSDYLLVNGHEPLEQGLSPMTFIGVTLFQIAKGVKHSKPFIIGYFCDRHRPFSIRGSETCKPVGMMLSLLGQLASQMVRQNVPVDLNFLGRKDWRKIKKRKMETLGDVFDSLTNQLPEHSLLYCILDEVFYYQQPGMDVVLHEILDRLTETARDCKERQKVEFKLLVTNRKDMRDREKIFDGHRIDLPEWVETRDSSMTVLENFGNMRM